MGARMGFVIALLVTFLLTALALKWQIEATGELRQKLEQREIDMQQMRQSNQRLQADIIARDQAIARLEQTRVELAARAHQVRTVIREVYRDPDARQWAEIAPPAAVVAVAVRGIDCLWQPGADTAGSDCADQAPGASAGGLPAPGG